jgi:hypothetical protein
MRGHGRGGLVASRLRQDRERVARRWQGRDREMELPAGSRLAELLGVVPGGGRCGRGLA